MMISPKMPKRPDLHAVWWSPPSVIEQERNTITETIWVIIFYAFIVFYAFIGIVPFVLAVTWPSEAERKPIERCYWLNTRTGDIGFIKCEEVQP